MDKSIISKELLSEVLGSHIESVHDKIINNKIQFDYYIDDIGGIDIGDISIYELAHKCKEWAKENDYILSSGFIARCDGAYCEIFNRWDFEEVPKHTTNAQTEPEAISKACQWINDNKK